MFLFDMAASGRQNGTTKIPKTPKKAKPKAQTKEKKTEQDEMEALQITFYEIESWIEKTTPVLTRMTKELDKASHHFEKRRKKIDQEKQEKQEHLHPEPESSLSSLSPLPPPSIPSTPQIPSISSIPSIPSIISQELCVLGNDELQTDNPMKWALSFQPGSALRLETNITSIEQLIDAVQKIRLLSNPEPGWTPDDEDDENNIVLCSNTNTMSLALEPDTPDAADYWKGALLKRPQYCLEDYKHCDMNLARLTKDVSTSVLNYICQIYWDCLHPKFSANVQSFWERSGDPKRNQVCIDSEFAIVFLHGIRHQKNICANAHEIACYYYDRARDALMDFFDAPDCTTIETLENLSIFCTLCKRYSQARIYISLAMRMMIEFGMHKRATLPTDPVLRRKYLKLPMVLFYNDFTLSTYSGEPSQFDDKNWDIDLYEILELNKKMPDLDDRTLAKEEFFVHQLELIKINKRIVSLVEEYKRQQHTFPLANELPSRWAKRVQAHEGALAEWYDRTPDYFRVDPQSTAFSAASAGAATGPADQQSHGKGATHHDSNNCAQPIEAQAIRDQSALLLMLQYQHQWLLLHKTFLNPTVSSASSTSTTTSNSREASPRFSQRSDSPLSAIYVAQTSDRSQAICSDAAHRIVVLAERINQLYRWCVCQQFVNCIYNASTIYCRMALVKDENSRRTATRMIQRVLCILATGCNRYQGLPNDLTESLNEFLLTNNLVNNKCKIEYNNEDYQNQHQYQHQHQYQYQQEPECAEESTSVDEKQFQDNLPNSPSMHAHCLSLYRQQKKHSRQRSSLAGSPKADPFVAIHIDDLDEEKKNWRYKYSSPNATQPIHRIM
ncbi:fungal-specific transcription factor [Phycomyces blakesleeanus]|uniref:Fungal-specific transcription factor n=1 Tax=Phycomyces blakesleeanus TaxID=4837 RepID=A0ABR3B1C2_PHYBL